MYSETRHRIDLATKLIRSEHEAFVGQAVGWTREGGGGTSGLPLLPHSHPPPHAPSPAQCPLECPMAPQLPQACHSRVHSFWGLPSPQQKPPPPRGQPRRGPPCAERSRSLYDFPPSASLRDAFLAPYLSWPLRSDRPPPPLPPPPPPRHHRPVTQSLVC